MKFKIEEDLPAAARVFRGAGFDADTVGDEKLSRVDDETVASTSRSEGRVLVTLDLDFCDYSGVPAR